MHFCGFDTKNANSFTKFAAHFSGPKPGLPFFAHDFRGFADKRIGEIFGIAFAPLNLRWRKQMQVSFGSWSGKIMELIGVGIEMSEQRRTQIFLVGVVAIVILASVAGVALGNPLVN